MKTILNLLFLCLSVSLFGQVSNVETPLSVRNDGADPSSSAMLDVQSTTKGLLIPRMTSTQRDNIASPATGLLVFVTTDDSFYYYDGSEWLLLLNENDGSTVWGDGFGDEIFYNDGFVGVGLTDPNAPLDVYSVSSLTSRIRTVGLSGGDKTSLYVTASNADFVNSGDELIGVDALTSGSDGTNIGVRTTTTGTAGTNVALQAIATGDDSHAALFDGKVTFNDNDRELNTLSIYPRSTGSGDSSAVFFAEDNNGTFGMMVLYDGSTDKMFWYGRSNGTIGKLMELDRDDARLELADDAIVLDPDFGGSSRIITDELEIKGGSDFAERFDITSSEKNEILPGTLVSINEDSPGALRISSTAYDRAVVGVVSGANGIRPGVMMGQEGSIAHGDHTVSLSGRVYVRANDQNGNIKPGDFLTSSSIEGEAMRAKNIKKGQGAIIGKAMSSIDDSGFVLVLLNLQ